MNKRELRFCSTITCTEMKQAKSILVRYINWGGGEENETKQKEALTGPAITVPEIKGIYRNTNS